MPCGQAVMKVMIKGVIMNEPHPSQTAKDTALLEAIASQIKQDGPLSLANYIGLALGDADHGY